MGVVMCETLADYRPFKERTTIETIRRQIKESGASLRRSRCDAGCAGGSGEDCSEVLAQEP